MRRVVGNARIAQVSAHVYLATRSKTAPEPRRARAARVCAPFPASSRTSRALAAACVRCRASQANSSDRFILKQMSKVTDMPLSDCARDHRSVIMSLSAAQFSARYPLACEERWGGPKCASGVAASTNQSTA